MKTIFDFSVRDRKGKAVALREYQGEVLLTVNTATKSPLTPQYADLQRLFATYHSRGFEVLDFPCNQFGAGAPGTDETIHTFCKETYSTEFPRFKKVKATGPDADPLFKFLTEQKPAEGGNFDKFLTNRYGMVVARFAGDCPIDEVEKQIEALL